MTPTLTVRRFCCPDCGGRQVQTLDWITMNGDELLGGDLSAHFWCPDCESHPSHVVERDVVIGLCPTCAGHAWGTRVPLPGVVLRGDGSIRCCELCALYPSDRAAARAVGAELNRRGQGPARIAVFVPGVGRA